METIKTSITLDDLDLMTAVLEGFADSLPEDNEDFKAINNLLDNLADFTDKICSLSEYKTGNDWPEDLGITLSCSADDIK